MMVNNLHQKYWYKNLFFCAVCFKLPPIYPSYHSCLFLFFTSGRNRYVFPSLLLMHFFGNKICRTQQNQTSKEQQSTYWMMSWWFCVFAFFWHSCDIQSLSHTFRHYLWHSPNEVSDPENEESGRLGNSQKSHWWHCQGEWSGFQ